MLETKCVGDNLKKLVTALTISVTNILYLLILALGTNIHKNYHQHHNVTHMTVAFGMNGFTC